MIAVVDKMKEIRAEKMGEVERMSNLEHTLQNTANVKTAMLYKQQVELEKLSAVKAEHHQLIAKHQLLQQQVGQLGQCAIESGGNTEIKAGEECEVVKSHIKYLGERVHVLEGQADQYTENYLKAEETVKNLSEQLKRMEASVISLSVLKQQTQQEFQQITIRVDATTHRILETDRELARRKAENDQMKSENEQVFNQMESLKKTKEAEISQLESTFKILSLERDSLSWMLTDSQAQLNILKKKVVDLEQQMLVEKVTKQVNATSKDDPEVSALRDSLNQIMAKYQKCTNDQRDLMDWLQTQSKTPITTLADAQKLFRKNIHNNSKMRQELVVALDNQVRLEQEMSRLQDKLQAAQDVERGLVDQITTYQDQQLQSPSKDSSLTQVIMAKEQELEKIRQERDECLAAFTKLQGVSETWRIKLEKKCIVLADTVEKLSLEKTEKLVSVEIQQAAHAVEQDKRGLEARNKIQETIFSVENEQSGVKAVITSILVDCERIHSLKQSKEALVATSTQNNTDIENIPLLCEQIRKISEISRQKRCELVCAQKNG